jgi:tRNA A-37 threonylcarbamoyl transferase component Bud32
MIKAFEAISFLHHHGFRHGDIRTDHLFIERETGNYVWIDFDYDYETSENPFGLDIFGLGNVLLYALGKGFYELYEIKSHPRTYGNLVESLEPGDFSVLDKFRLLNLRKIFPYLPKCFNDILLHFSFGADVFYETVDEIIEDLNRCISLEYD